MTKELSEGEARERTMSVPKILHDGDGDGEGLIMPEANSKLLQRRRLLQAEPQQLPPAHGRSCSFRNRPRPKLLNVETERPRRSSLPSPSANFLSVSYEDINSRKENTEPLRRVRSFKTTQKGGIINRGDSFKRSSTSVNSTGSAYTNENAASAGSPGRQRVNSTHSKDSGTAESTGSSAVPLVYKVAILGDKGVGKTSLANQFMTSEFIAFETDQDDVETERHVTVLLNAEESTLHFF